MDTPCMSNACTTALPEHQAGLSPESLCLPGEEHGKLLCSGEGLGGGRGEGRA